MIRENLTDYLIFRFIIFALAPTYIIQRYASKVIDPTQRWTPISFYTLLETPPPIEYIFYIKWASYFISLLAACGILFSISSKLATILTIVFLGFKYNFGHVYHSYHLYLGAMIILSFAPKCSNNKRDWHLEMVKYWVVYVMSLTGLQKLYYGGGFQWALSDNLYIRILILLRHTNFAKWILNSDIIISQMFALFSLLVTELLSSLSLINKKIGVLFFIIWTSFHIFVTLTFGGHKMFYTQVFVYTAFLPLSTIAKRKILVFPS